MECIILIFFLEIVSVGILDGPTHSVSNRVTANPTKRVTTCELNNWSSTFQP